MYGATCLADCLTVVRPARKCGIAYNFSHLPSGEWGTLWWETETHRPHWLPTTSKDGGNWTQQFFLSPEELPDVIKILFKEGWTWK